MAAPDLWDYRADVEGSFRSVRDIGYKVVITNLVQQHERGCVASVVASRSGAILRVMIGVGLWDACSLRGSGFDRSSFRTWKVVADAAGIEAGEVVPMDFDLACREASGPHVKHWSRELEAALWRLGPPKP